MSRRKTITPRAVPRQAEVISLAAFRGLRETHHRPSLALDIIHSSPDFVTKTEARFALTFAKRSKESPKGKRAQVLPFNKYGFKVGDLVIGKLKYRSDGECAARITALEVDTDGDCTLSFNDEKPLYDASFYEPAKGGVR